LTFLIHIVGGDEKEAIYSILPLLVISLKSGIFNYEELENSKAFLGNRQLGFLDMSFVPRLLIEGAISLFQ